MPDLALSPFLLSSKEQFGRNCRKYCRLYLESFDGEAKGGFIQEAGVGSCDMGDRGECLGAVQYNSHICFWNK
jgi:hypothetical protein